MRRALLVVLMLLVPLQAAALDNDELLGLVAMPLAVAAVSDVTGVPAGDLGRFVSVLNRAAVPPTQVIQVVRYAPVALVVEQDPPFVDYVSERYYDGVTGPRLVRVIEDRYRTYDLEPDFVALREPATTYVVRDDYVPPVVVTRVAQVQPLGYQQYGYQPVAYDTNDLLALAAMPLAVAAVSEISGVPFDQLTGLMTSLNAARMPPVQVVEVLRYAPVALIADYGQPRFVPYIQTQVVSGIRGPALIEVIDTRLRSYDVAPRFVYDTRPDVIVYDDYDDYDAFFPPVVRTRIAEVRSHPHGGPPGQLKKELGLQTGAEVVHGTRVDRDRVRSVRVERDGRASARLPERRVVEQRSEPARKARAARKDRSERRVVEAREPARKVRAEKRERVRTERRSVDRPSRSRAERSVERAKPPRAQSQRMERRGGGAERTSVRSKGGGGKGKGNGKGKG